MKIINRINELILREKPEKKVKYSEGSGIAKHLTNTPRNKLYEYYICDNCGCEIKVEKKWENNRGGLLMIPKTLSKRNKIFYIAVCSKCLNKVLKEFEDEK